MERQAILTRVEPDPPPTFHAVLNQAAVLREVGGPDIMHGQIDSIPQGREPPEHQYRHPAVGSRRPRCDGISLRDHGLPDQREDPSVVYIDTPSSAA